MEKLFIQQLQRLEREEEIRILYAVESGSRAWGFASKNSDWDVRFLYVHRPEWYLRIDRQKDTLERMLPHDLDLSGWDLPKALRLFRKGNPALLEWLRCPVVYLEQGQVAQQMRELRLLYFDPKACMYHYLHMAGGNWRQYLQGRQQVRLKKYFYVLRPLLACAWVEEEGTMPPVEFDQLVETQVQQPELKAAIHELTERKKAGEELEKGTTIPVLHDFLAKQLAHFTEAVKRFPKREPPRTEPLDKLFLSALREQWGLELDSPQA